MQAGRQAGGFLSFNLSVWKSFSKGSSRLSASSSIAAMNTTARTTRILTAPLRRSNRRVRPSARHLATHPPHANQEDPPLSSSTQDLLDRLAKEAAKNAASSASPNGRPLIGTAGQGKPYVGNVGPFPMGVGLGSNIRNKDWKKWRDLGLGGKRSSVVESSRHLRC